MAAALAGGKMVWFSQEKAFIGWRALTIETELQEEWKHRAKNLLMKGL